MLLIVIYDSKHCRCFHLFSIAASLLLSYVYLILEKVFNGLFEKGLQQNFCKKIWGGFVLGKVLVGFSRFLKKGSGKL